MDATERVSRKSECYRVPSSHVSNMMLVICSNSRHLIRTRKDLDIDQYLDGTGHLEIAPDLLKLYLWTLRSILLPGDEETREDEELQKKINAVVSHYFPDEINNK